MDPKLCQSQTTSVKVNTKRNLVHLTKKSCFDLSLTAPTLGVRGFIGVKKLFSHTEVSTHEGVERNQYQN